MEHESSPLKPTELESTMNPRDHIAEKIGVLVHLRDLFHESAVTREKLPIELTLVAADLGIAEVVLQGTIAELVALDLAKPTSSAKHLAVSQGECEITRGGLTYLHEYETALHVPSESRRSIGFGGNRPRSG